MKRIVSVIIIIMMALNYVPTCLNAIELFNNTTEVVSILEESTERKIVIYSEKAVSDLILYVAAFKDNAMIGSVSKRVNLEIGNNTFDVEPTWSVEARDLVKFFLWDKNLTPYAEKIVAKTPIISVETVYADTETNTVEVEVSILNNPGISSLKFDVEYDTDLTLIDVELSKTFGTYLTAAEPYTNPQPISLIAPFDDINTSGVLATLTFDISNVPVSKRYTDINIVCDAENIFDANFDFVDFKETNGKIIFDETITPFECMEDYNSLLMATEQFTLTIEEVTGMPGDTVEVDLTLSNNPGIASLMFDVEYDEILTLESVSFNSDFGSYATAAQPFKNPQPISFISPFNNVNVNGSFATLKFKIADTAEDRHIAEINVTYSKDDIFDSNYNYVDMTVMNGNVTVYEGLPGDINADGKVNNMDAIIHFRYVAKWSVSVDEEALDVTGDGKVNNVDAIQLFRYVAKWPGIVLVRGKVCEHTLEAFGEKKATCTEFGKIAYWHCTKCDRYYSDSKATNVISVEDTVIAATGHSIVSIPAVTPTYTETGLTEGKKCSVCGIVTVKQEIIPVLQQGEYSIQYMCDMVPIGTDNKPITYEPDTYKPTQTKVLPMPKMDTYKFLGWSDKDGKMYGTEIPKGTTGDLVLYANWASNRNKAIPVKEIGDPIICEDSNEGQIIFVYEIGRIENIPLFEKQKLLVANGLITRTGTVIQESIIESNAEEIGKSIANTTTNSSTWTFSEDWNETMSVSEEWAIEQGMTIEEAEAFSRSNNNTYNMTNSIVNSSSLVNATDSTYRLSGNQAHKEETYDEKQKYTAFNVDGKLSNSTTVDVGVSAELNAGLGAGLKIPLFKIAEASINGNVGGSIGAEVGLSNTFAWEIGGGYEQKNFTKEITTGTDSWENSIDISNSKSSTSTAMKTWNSSEGYTSSTSTSSTQSVSKAVSELISQKNSKDSSYTTGGSNGEAKEYATSNAQQDKYSSSVTYSTEKISTSEIAFESTGNTYGAYRLVQVGMARVYAVIGYDIRDKSYYTYTYSVLDDDKYEEYLDYSYDRTFDDYETSVLPFEIPIFVNDYVNSRIASSKLQVTDDGIVKKYLGDADDEIILIPSYYTRVNSTTGKAEMIKIKGIEPGLFKNNTNIVGVSLGNFVNEIPESAFEGCTALKEVICPNVIKIGAYAFKGCSSLSEFALPNEIEFIGEEAFEGITSLKAKAPTKEIAKIIAKSNVQNITLDISSVKADDYSDMIFEVGEISNFKLLGDGEQQYNGLSIKTDAANTVISSINIPKCDVIPIEVSSKKLTLERVSAHGNGIALLIKADETTLSIEGVSKITSDSENSIVSQTINLESINEETYSAVETNGNVLVCGTVNNNDGYIEADRIKIITQAEFDMYEKGVFNIQLDANGGKSDKESLIAYYNTKVSGLPIPQRDYYTFAGWFTEKDGGKEYKEGDIYSEIKNITLYARWIANEYTVKWNTDKRYIVTVNRISSPNADAETGVISSGDAVYYGDVLSISYEATSGYSIKTQGEPSIIVKENITEDDIYATAEANEYTYNIVYKSVNGTSLGTMEAVTYKYDTTNEIAPKAFVGYTTPSAQSVVWDSTSAKTITFEYVPNSVGNTTKTGQIYSSPQTTFSAKIQYQNRTATSIQIRVVWTDTMIAGGYNQYSQYFSASVNGGSKVTAQIVAFGAWNSAVSYSRSSTGTSKWITVPVSATATSVSVKVSHYQQNYYGDSYGDVYSATWTVPIPTY